MLLNTQNKSLEIIILYRFLAINNRSSGTDIVRIHCHSLFKRVQLGLRLTAWAVCELHPGPHKHRRYALYLRWYINEVDIKQLSEAYDARQLPASIKKKENHAGGSRSDAARLISSAEWHANGSDLSGTIQRMPRRLLHSGGDVAAIFMCVCVCFQTWPEKLSWNTPLHGSYIYTLNKVNLKANSLWLMLSSWFFFCFDCWPVIGKYDLLYGLKSLWTSGLNETHLKPRSEHTRWN